MAGIVVTAAATALLLSGCGSKPAPVKDVRAEAQKVCEQWLLAKLKAPSSAEIGGQAVKGPDAAPGPWVVTGWVDAQNSFGAKLRSNWACDIRLDDGTYNGKAYLVEK